MNLPLYTAHGQYVQLEERGVKKEKGDDSFGTLSLVSTSMAHKWASRLACTHPGVDITNFKPYGAF
jgi:hypothetical protein